MVQVIMKIEIHRIKYSISTRNKRVYPLFLLCMCVGGKVKSNRSLLAILECVGGVYTLSSCYICVGGRGVSLLFLLYICVKGSTRLYICVLREQYPISSCYTCVCAGGEVRVFSSFCYVSMGVKVFPFFLLYMYEWESLSLLLLYMCLGANIVTKT